MRLDRVLQMPVTEMVVRGRQEASKWFDRAAMAEARATRSDHVSPRLLGGLRERLSMRFFASAAHDETTARLIARMPGTRGQIISSADAICRGRFDLLGYRELDFGDPVDWRLDPISGRRAPRVHWSRLDPLDPAVVGDCKVVWELNRHQWLLHLGEAYRFTGDDRYAEVFARSVLEWMRANPPGIGINWASSLEVAYRLIAWCWGLALFEGSPVLSAGLFAEMLGGIEAHARHIERYLSYYFAPNTHLTGEALGLFYAGVLFAELSRAQWWRKLGTEILVTQCERQILQDGVYFEQSTCYQRYTAEIYLHFLILSARNGLGVPDTVAQRLQRLLDFLVAIRHPDGSIPQIGDVDGGWVLPLVSRSPDDLRGVFSVAAAFFKRSDYAWAAGGTAPEVLWLLGPTGETALGALVPAPPETAPSRLFPEGGYAVMRTGWEKDAHQMVFDVGPLGPLSAGHGHADLLSIQCSVFGERYVVDAGTYCYASDPAWQDYLRATAAHSTVRVDGRDQAIPAGPFKWQALPEARLQRWLSTETLDIADAEHDGYTRLPGRVRHRRRVLFVKPRYWVIVDDLEGSAEHRVELTFQFAPLTATVGPDLWARARWMGDNALLIRPFATVALRGRIYMGEIAPLRGWVSPNYGQRTPAPALVYEADADLPLRMVTLLLPVKDALAPPPAVSPLYAEDGTGPVGLHFIDFGERVQLDPNGPVIKSL